MKTLAAATGGGPSYLMLPEKVTEMCPTTESLTL